MKRFACWIRHSAGMFGSSYLAGSTGNPSAPAALLRLENLQNCFPHIINSLLYSAYLPISTTFFDRQNSLKRKSSVQVYQASLRPKVFKEVTGVSVGKDDACIAVAIKVRFFNFTTSKRAFFMQRYQNTCVRY